MDDTSSSSTPESISVQPPAPQALPTHKPSLHDVLFGNQSEYKYEQEYDQESLASFDEIVPEITLPDPPPREIHTGKQQDVISVSEDTFFDDRSLEARIHRSLLKRPSSGTIKTTTSQRRLPSPKAGLSREAKLERTLEQTRNELSESHKRISDLRTENEILHEEYQRLQQKLAHQDHLTGSKLREEIARLQHVVKDLGSQNTEVEIKGNALLQQTKLLEAENERMAETWQLAERDADQAQRECAKWKKELESCRNDVADTKKSRNMLEMQLLDLRQHNKLLEEKISEEAQKSASTVAEMQCKVDKCSNDYKDLQAKMQEVSLQLDAKSKECEGLMTTKAQLEGLLTGPPVEHRGMQTDAVPVTSTVKHVRAERPLNLKRPHSLSITPLPVSGDSTLIVQTSPTSDSPSDNTLGERLARIRESAEKASLVREHQRDMSRLQSEHAAQIATLQHEFDDEIARLAEDSQTELNHRIKELKRRIVTEYEKKLDELERKHAKEILRIRDETDRQSTAAMESVETAMSELAKTTTQLESETRKCHALEMDLKKRESEHGKEKERLIYELERELQAIHVGWEEEKHTLLTLVQTECNAVIEKTREKSFRTSPKALRSFFTTTPKSSTTFFAAEVSPITLPDPAHGSPTVSLSELSQSLLETEAMVEKVLRN